MSQTIISPNDEPGRQLVDVHDLPKSALSAILKKLSEKTQRSSQIYKDNYSVSVSDVRNLVEKVRQEFHDNDPLSETLSVSLHLSNNQSYEFTSWPEFEGFDTSHAERTKSLSFEYSRAFEGRDGSLERYKVQVACQNISGRLNFYLGPIAISRIEDAGLPPVPIHASVSYSNYIRGKNLTGVIDSWVKSLGVEDGKVINFLQKHSGHFPYLGKSVATVAAILGCLSFVPSSDATVSDLGRFLGNSALFVFCAYSLGYVLATFLERQVDSYKPKSMISFTKGDSNYDLRVSKRNGSSIRKALLCVFGIIVQVSCSLSASYLYEYLLKFT